MLKSGDNWLKGRLVTRGQFLKKFGRKIDEVRRKKVHNILEALHFAMSPPAKLVWLLVNKLSSNTGCLQAGTCIFVR